MTDTSSTMITDPSVMTTTNESSIDSEAAEMAGEDKEQEVELTCLERLRKLKDSFEIRVILVMCVPIFFLVGVSGSQLLSAIKEFGVLHDHRDLIAFTFDCQERLFLERLRSSVYMAQSEDDSYGAQFALTSLHSSRDKTDLVCAQAKDKAEESDDSSIKNFHMVEKASSWEELQVVRYQIDEKLVSGSGMRKFYSKIVETVMEVLPLIAKHSVEGGPILRDLGYARLVSNYVAEVCAVALVMMRFRADAALASSTTTAIPTTTEAPTTTTAAAIFTTTTTPEASNTTTGVNVSTTETDSVSATEDVNATTDPLRDGDTPVASPYTALREELLKVQSILASVERDFELVAKSDGQFFMQSWKKHMLRRQLMSMIDVLQNDEAIMLTSDDWFMTSIDALLVLKALSAPLLDEALRPSAVDTRVKTGAIVLSVALVLSAAAGAFIIRTNYLASRTIEQTEKRVRVFQRSISCYVPRDFLKLMGARSITTVTLGETTNVSVCVLSSTIRHFRAVSETLCMEDLFQWLQDYFKRMTQVIQSNDGFIDKFLGDGIVAIHKDAVSAVQCAIDIETAADQMNIDIVANQGEQLLELGVGVHTAVVSAGMIGSKLRKTPMFAASELNVASSLVLQSAVLGARILITGITKDNCNSAENEFEIRTLGTITIGSRREILYEVIQADVMEVKLFKLETKDEFEAGIAACEGWGGAAAGLEKFEILKKKADARLVTDDVLNAKIHQLRAVTSGGNVNGGDDVVQSMMAMANRRTSVLSVPAQEGNAAEAPAETPAAQVMDGGCI